jgi:hypothetical protein
MSLTEGTASAVLALSKAAWTVGVSLSTLNEDTEIIGSTIKNLAEEVRSFGNVCDLACATLQEVIDKSDPASPLSRAVDSRLWDCLATQVDEACQMIQELELFVKIVRGEETRFIGQAQRLRRLDKSKDKIAQTRAIVVRHTDDLRFTLLLLKTWAASSMHPYSAN